MEVEPRRQVGPLGKSYHSNSRILKIQGNRKVQTSEKHIFKVLKHKLDQDSRMSSLWEGEIAVTSDMQMIPFLWQKAKRN